MLGSVRNTSSSLILDKTEQDLSELTSNRSIILKKHEQSRSKERSNVSRVKDFLKNAEHTRLQSSISLECIIGSTKTPGTYGDLTEIESNTLINPFGDDSEFNLYNSYNDEQERAILNYPVTLFSAFKIFKSQEMKYEAEKTEKENRKERENSNSQF